MYAFGRAAVQTPLRSLSSSLATPTWHTSRRDSSRALRTAASQHRDFFFVLAKHTPSPPRSSRSPILTHLCPLSLPPPPPPLSLLLAHTQDEDRDRAHLPPQEGREG